MVIIGDSLIPFEEFYKIDNIQDIKNSKPNQALFFSYNSELLKYCYTKNLDFYILVNSINESIYASNLNAKYIICKKNLAKKLQKIADNYMWDSKILTIIKTSEEFEEIASLEIDGVIYKDLLEDKK